jgi:large subunit ribosomal protein L32
MGAVPKVRISKSRKNKRRAHDGLEEPAMATCAKCGQTKRPHYKCPSCGHYGGDQAAEIKAEKSAPKSASSDAKSKKKSDGKDEKKSDN